MSDHSGSIHLGAHHLTTTVVLLTGIALPTSGKALFRLTPQYVGAVQVVSRSPATFLLMHLGMTVTPVSDGNLVTGGGSVFGSGFWVLGSANASECSRPLDQWW